MDKQETRDYGRVRDLIESLGGRMEWLPGGGPGGVWELTLGEYTATIPARDRRVNSLDRLYVPAVENPQTWDDYAKDAPLVEDAPERLVALLVKG
jgi:hypothetical protein